MKWDKTFFYVKWRIKSHHDMRYQQHIHHARWLWRHVKKVVTFFKTRKFFPIIFISWIFLAIWKFLSIFFYCQKIVLVNFFSTLFLSFPFSLVLSPSFFISFFHNIWDARYDDEDEDTQEKKRNCCWIENFMQFFCCYVNCIYEICE